MLMPRGYTRARAAAASGYVAFCGLDNSDKPSS